MTTAEEYASIAQAAYRADPLWKTPPYASGQRFHPPGKPGQIFEVVPPPPVHDPVTGFQAITVVPVVNGVRDFSQVSIAYAGTNPGHHADLSADAQIVVGGQTGSATQAAEALAYAKQVMATHPGARFETVGHSLGGYLAQYVSGKLHVPSTTFNGPDAWDSLSDEDKKWYRAEVAAGRKPWSRYLNEWDLIGNYPGDPSGSAIHVKGKPGQEFFDNHNIPTAFGFDPRDGSVMGAGVKGRSLEAISENTLSGLPEGVRIYVAPLLTGALVLLRNPAVGAVAGMLGSGLTVMMDTLAASSMAANFIQLEEPLRSIKAVNSGLIPQMEQGLREAKTAVAMIPFITEADIENCAAINRLQVHHNIDQNAVDAVNRRVDEHLDTVHKLAVGIASAAQNALAQDKQWASTYAGL
ncbi:hypothetical protein AB4Z18_14515 [Leifsonia sp. 2TAF2]|uniref:hypothetical protein n=1 Tax=Leifsonia sp. 2TAF2 TaxID=3233009 RepID=UPI003F97970D